MALFAYPGCEDDVNVAFAPESAKLIIEAMEDGKNPEVILSLMSVGEPKEGNEGIAQEAIRNFKAENGYPQE